MVVRSTVVKSVIKHSRPKVIRGGTLRLHMSEIRLFSVRSATRALIEAMF